MEPFANIVKRAQRLALASDLTEAYDALDDLLARARDLNSVEMDISSSELHDIFGHISAAKEQLFLARVIADQRDKEAVA